MRKTLLIATAALSLGAGAAFAQEGIADPGQTPAFALPAARVLSVPAAPRQTIRTFWHSHAPAGEPVLIGGDGSAG